MRPSQPTTGAFGRGSRGEKIRDLRERLERLGFGRDPHERADDRLTQPVFDEETAEAVREFQQSRGLTADGIVGPETWQALTAAGYALGDRLLYYRTPMLSGDDVAELQSRLNAIGFDAGRSDGLFGPETETAVRQFQKNAALAVDGVVGPETLASLATLGSKAPPSAGGSPAEALRQTTTPGEAPLCGKRIVVDPRDGPERDPAKPGRSRIVRAIAEELAVVLKQADALAVITRAPGESPSPEERAAIANSAAADIVISIGANWLADLDASGIATYYFATESARSEAGRKLAKLCQEELVASLGLPDCRIHGKSWTILRRTRAPAVVLEPGFVSNPHDRALLESDGPKLVASAVTRALERFFNPG